MTFLNRYDKICKFIIKRFIRTYFIKKGENIEDIKWEAVESENWGYDNIFINDYYFSFTDIFFAVKNKVSKKILFAYYDDIDNIPNYDLKTFNILMCCIKNFKK
jgi:hypothetical protein